MYSKSYETWDIYSSEMRYLIKQWSRNMRKIVASVTSHQQCSYAVQDCLSTRMSSPKLRLCGVSFSRMETAFPVIWYDLLFESNDVSASPSMQSRHLISNALQWRHDGGLKSLDSPVFDQPCIQPQIKENIKAPRHWPLCGEFPGDRWIPCTNGQWRGKCFHLMTSSWKVLLQNHHHDHDISEFVTTPQGNSPSI